MDEAHENQIRAAVTGDDGALTSLLEEAALALRPGLDKQIGDRYRSSVDVDDILQITCIEVFMRIRSFDPARAGAFFSWMRHVAENNLRDAIRELERDKRPSPGKRTELPPGSGSYFALLEGLAITTSTPSRIAVRDELRQGVDAALRALPPDYACVLRLYELDSLTGEEIAERMGRRPGAVRMLLARARERLREILAANPQFTSTA